MIKIKRISPEQFYDNLSNNAMDCGHDLNIFKKTNYKHHEIGFYYNIKDNRTTIYYETGEKSKSDGITENKSFLLCYNKKIFRKDYLFCILTDNLDYWAIFSIIFVYGLLFFGEIIRNLILKCVFVIVGYYFINSRQKLKLLNFIDEICENRNTGDR